MAEHPNLEVMRRALKAFQTGDLPTLTQVFAQDVVWRVPGRNPVARDYRGQAEVFGFFGRLMELTAGTFKIQSIEVFANDRGGVFVDQVTAERNGKTLDVRLLLHVTISGGQITRRT